MTTTQDATLRQKAAERFRSQITQGIVPRRKGPLPHPSTTDHGTTNMLQATPKSAGNGQTPPVSETSYYSRMFGDLSPYSPDDRALGELGAPCGPMDANPPGTGKCLSPGSKVAENQLNTKLPAGYTYFGQFLDHNITFQADATFDPGNNPKGTTNYRSGRISLEHVYGLGPQTQSFAYYDNGDNGKFWLDPARGYDVPRNGEGVPIIADPRNDNTIITIQLHLAFMKFHNAVVDMLKKDDTPYVSDKDLFATAQRLVIWHYQWLVLHDWLENIIQKNVFEAITKNDGGRFFNPKPGESLALPVEFTVAGYRLHALVQEEYRLNDKTAGHLFHFRKPFAPLTKDVDIIDWSHFFKIGGREPQYAKKFDGKIVHTFLNIPGPIDTPIEWIEDPTEQSPLPSRTNEQYTPMRSIAIRNLLRGKAFNLPSGQDVATKIQQAYGTEIVPKVYDNRALGLTVNGLGDKAPLWYYVMRESMVAHGGERLGAVGSVIVGEVLYGLLKADPSSFVNHNRENPGKKWEPMNGRFTVADMLQLAGVA
ncbi:peroxidase family protein [Actinomadura sp. 9N407]|uniref:peroxidase family protein n=1 Tax=Actinomadura sp. 9N407 TaxID=3375154 RepID=UPI0037BAE43E